MAYVPSYRGERHLRRPTVAHEETGRWSVRRALFVMIGISVAGWAAIAGLTAIVAG
jgi:hypothetical protein